MDVRYRILIQPLFHSHTQTRTLQPFMACIEIVKFSRGTHQFHSIVFAIVFRFSRIVQFIMNDLCDRLICFGNKKHPENFPSTVIKAAFCCVFFCRFLRYIVRLIVKTLKIVCTVWNLCHKAERTTKFTQIPFIYFYFFFVPNSYFVPSAPL